MARLSSTLAGLKFMSKKPKTVSSQAQKTFSYYAYKRLGRVCKLTARTDRIGKPI